MIIIEKTAKKRRGCPTKYKKEYCRKIIEFFDVEPQETTTRETFYPNGKLKSKEQIVNAQTLPTFQGFAHKISVHVDTLHEWCKEYAEFSEAYARAKQLQENIWLVNGLSNLYNAQFAMFFGKNCLGYRDKSELDVGNSDGKVFKFELSVIDKLESAEHADET
ncbi:MAG: terminase small subunit [Oscillospiraceae bacterium]